MMRPRKTKREMERQLHGGAHDDFMQLFTDRPDLGDLAREVGIIQGNEIPRLRPTSAVAPPFPAPMPMQIAPGPKAGLPQGINPSILGGYNPSSVNGMDMEVAAAAAEASRLAAVAGLCRPMNMGFGDLLPQGGNVGLKRMRKQIGGVDLSKTKGLRHFSMLVCKKVEEKGTTTYNEVAEELVVEYKRDVETAKKAAEANPQLAPSPQTKVYDEKNVRRRVYDALNVLMAMDIISKEKKQIKWRGLPTNARQDLEMLRREKEARSRSIARKREQLQEHLVQYLSFDNIASRNADREAKSGKNSSEESSVDQADKLDLPFIVVTTSQQTLIQCEMAPNRESVFFSFNGAFEVHDDMEIIKRLDLHNSMRPQAAAELPPNIREYLPEKVKRQKTA